MKTELKSCPFCGGRAFVKHITEPVGDSYKVYCGNEDCLVSPETHWLFKRDQAIKVWNRRTSDGI